MSVVLRWFRAVQAMATWIHDRPSRGSCDSCQTVFRFELVHNGFNESFHAYCDACGATLLLDTGDPRARSQMQRWTWAGSVDAEIESSVPACECGGKFRGSASPRCPVCKHELNAEEAAKWIEHSAPANRWRRTWAWQRNWRGLYAIVIEDRVRFEPERSRE